jgi:hypothetical protein
MAQAKRAARRKKGRKPFRAIEKRGRERGSGISPWRRRETFIAVTKRSKACAFPHFPGKRSVARARISGGGAEHA